MTDHRSEEADKLLGQEFKVLDHGFVRLVDYMGNDGAIVQAARVSYGKGTKKVSRDRELIRYLLGHQHTSPFEMVEFKFHVKLPIFVARQWIRHRTANVNEYSGRYSVMKEEFYRPEADQIRLQSEVNKQGRSDEAAPDELRDDFLAHSADMQKRAYEKYSGYLAVGLARELARVNLPLSMYTEWYWKIDLHNLMHFLKLRIDPHAQYEIRQYALAMGEIVKTVCPISWEAFEDYILQAEKFSSIELRVLQAKLSGLAPDQDALVAAGLSTLEAAEFLDKLTRIQKL
jgi:thymidylate synthase (FAD)